MGVITPNGKMVCPGVGGAQIHALAGERVREHAASEMYFDDESEAPTRLGRPHAAIGCPWISVSPSLNLGEVPTAGGGGERKS